MKDILDNNIFASEGGQNQSDEITESFDKAINPSFEFDIEQTTPQIKEMIKNSTSQQYDQME